jgi:hypothetical protein
MEGGREGGREGGMKGGREGETLAEADINTPHHAWTRAW